MSLRRSRYPGVVAGEAFTPSDRFLNRELTWLDFNERVLALATDHAVPLLERAKFCAIFSQNLDEFFQVRVAGLKDQVDAGLVTSGPDGRTPAHQLAEVADRVAELVARQQAVFAELVRDLAAAGVVLSRWDELDDDDRTFLVGEFEERIFPVLTPLAVDPGHPFPYISDLSLNLAVVLRDPDTHDRRFARVKVPATLPRFVVLPDGERFVPLEQVIAAHLSRLFPGMEVEEHVAFRVTRNADLTVEEEDADDLLLAVELELRRRRFGRAVRLEVGDAMSVEVRELLRSELDLAPDDVYASVAPLDLGGLWALQTLDRPELRDRPWRPVTPARLAPAEGETVDLFAVIAAGDLLVHHPYESFATSVEEFIRQASVDPGVLTIKVTLYRTSGDSEMVRSLIRAAEHGKQVAALVEVKARFDEAANIEWARALEEAGVHVTYGLVGLKTHCKVALVVRDEAGRLRRYAHVATGNYNATTAKVYEDLGLFTTNGDLCADLAQLFNFLTGYARDISYRHLLVAPHSLRSGLEGLVRAEIAAAQAGTPAGITLKVNNLVDPRMIDLLYEASAAGVPIDLIVRGSCCLRPGVVGLSEGVRVRSIIGRFLEHSRIYRFANGGGSGVSATYIGSADLMQRNLDRRVETLVPVLDARLRERLDDVLATAIADDTLAWTLGSDGRWAKANGGTVDSQARGQELALARTRRREVVPGLLDGTHAAPIPAPSAGSTPGDSAGAGSGAGPRSGAVSGAHAGGGAGADAAVDIAAGCLVWRRGEHADGPVELLLIHRPRYHDWSFPKGKLEAGETFEECALRELFEETGVRGVLGVEVAPTEYVDRKGRTKLVRYWAAQVASVEDGVALDGVDELRWVPVDTVADLLTYARDIPPLESFRELFPQP